MNDRLILSPPPAKNILLSTGVDVETAINRLNNSVNILNQRYYCEVYYDHNSQDSSFTS